MLQTQPLSRRWNLSLNLIFQNPLLFILIMFAIVVSIALAIMSVRKPKTHSIPEPESLPPPPIQETSLNRLKLTSSVSTVAQATKHTQLTV